MFLLCLKVFLIVSLSSNALLLRLSLRGSRVEIRILLVGYFVWTRFVTSCSLEVISMLEEVASKSFVPQ